MSLFLIKHRERRQAGAKLIQQRLLPLLPEPELHLDTLCSHEVDASLISVELSSQRPAHELLLVCTER